jgi:hypothetical protein
MRLTRLVACLATLVALCVACAARPPKETPRQIEAMRRAVAELEARLADIRLTFDREDVAGCRSLGIISQDFYATTNSDYFTGDIRRGVEFTAELAPRDGALKAGADTALMPLPVRLGARPRRISFSACRKETRPSSVASLARSTPADADRRRAE